MKRKVAVLLIIALTLTGCRASTRVSRNVSREADEFRVYRRIVFYNGITDTYILEMKGYCSINVNNTDNDLEVTCEVARGKYQKHFLGLSDNVTYTVEQLDDSNVSDRKYELIFKPDAIIPIKIGVE